MTEQNVRDGYAQYLTGFDELAGLKIAAACWQPGDAVLETPDVLHVFGVTSSEPPIYYYRAISGVEKATDTKSVEFAPWRKLDLQISAKTCSPVVHNGTLYVFWAEVATRPKTSLVNGSSKFTGYLHKLALKYSSLRLDGRWSAPQRLRIVQQSGETESIEITDRLVGADDADVSQLAGRNQRDPAVADTTLLSTISRGRRSGKSSTTTQQRAKDAMKYTAMWDPLARVQTEPLDDYTLDRGTLAPAVSVLASLRALGLRRGQLLDRRRLPSHGHRQVERLHEPAGSEPRPLPRLVDGHDARAEGAHRGACGRTSTRRAPSCSQIPSSTRRAVGI